MTTPKSVSLVQNSLKFLPLISNYMSCPLVRLIDIYIQLGHLNPWFSRPPSQVSWWKLHTSSCSSQVTPVFLPPLFLHPTSNPSVSILHCLPHTPRISCSHHLYCYHLAKPPSFPSGISLRISQSVCLCLAGIYSQDGSQNGSFKIRSGSLPASAQNPLLVLRVPQWNCSPSMKDPHDCLDLTAHRAPIPGLLLFP